MFRCEKIKKDFTSKIIYFLHVYLHFYSYRKLNLKILSTIHTILSLHKMFNALEKYISQQSYILQAYIFY